MGKSLIGKLQELLRRKRRVEEVSVETSRRYWRYPPSKAYGKRDTAEYCRESDEFIRNLMDCEIQLRDARQDTQSFKNRVAKWTRQRSVRTMMDFGCGLGQDGLYFARALGLKVTFVDIVPSNVELTRRFAKIWDVDTQSFLISGNPESCDFRASFDLIFSCGVLHHSPKAKQIVENLARHLNPGGLFIAMLYTREHFLRVGASNLAEYAIKSEAPAPERVQNPYTDVYDLQKTEKLFAGFELLDHWTTYSDMFGWYCFGKR